MDRPDSTASRGSSMHGSRSTRNSAHSSASRRPGGSYMIQRMLDDESSSYFSGGNSGGSYHPSDALRPATNTLREAVDATRAVDEVRMQGVELLQLGGWAQSNK